MKGLWLAATLLTVVLPAHADAGAHPPTQSTRTLDAGAAEAAAAVDAFHAALRRGDAAAAAALMADEAIIFESGEVERTKAEYVAHHLPADTQFEKEVASAVTDRTGGSEGSLAWIATEGRITGSYKGKPLDRLTTETMLLRRTDNGWKITHIHWSSGAAK
jgi:ketosteroid isomerase-like protein